MREYHVFCKVQGHTGRIRSFQNASIPLTDDIDFDIIESDPN